MLCFLIFLGYGKFDDQHQHTSQGLLCARLFNPDGVQAIEEELRSHPLNHLGEQDALSSTIKASNFRLKCFINTQFKCIPKSKWTPAHRDFVEGFVEPCRAVQTKSWSGAVVAQAHDIAKKMASSSLSSMEDLNLMMGCRIAAGG